MTEYKVKVFENCVEWYNLYGQLHREDGPALEYKDGGKEWWIHGIRHRENGPAIEYNNGTKCWYISGKLHRTDGPAIEYKDGLKQWYIHGNKYSEQGFNKYIHNLSNNLDGKIAEIDGLNYRLELVK